MLPLASDLIPRLYDAPAIPEMRDRFMELPRTPSGNQRRSMAQSEGPQSDNDLTNDHVEQRTASPY